MSIETFPSLATLVAFGAASLVLAVTPGPGVFFVVARTLAQGRRAGLASVAGVALGNLGNAAAASVGLAALLAVSSLAFMLVKIAGAAYLVWLAVQAVRGSAAARAGQPTAARVAHGRLFREGFVVALLNPKTALFFAAFLPQFIDPHRSLVVQFVVMAGTFAVTEFATEVFIASVAHRISAWLARVGRSFNRACGGIFIAIGALLPLRS